MTLLTSETGMSACPFVWWKQILNTVSLRNKEGKEVYIDWTCGKKHSNEIYCRPELISPRARNGHWRVDAGPQSREDGVESDSGLTLDYGLYWLVARGRQGNRRSLSGKDWASSSGE